MNKIKLSNTFIGLKKTESGIFVYDKSEPKLLETKNTKHFIYIADKKSIRMFKWSTLLMLVSIPFVVIVKVESYPLSSFRKNSFVRSSDFGVELV